MPTADLQLDAKQLREYIVRPTLVRLGMFSPAAENLVVGTAAQESRIDYVKQLGRGPARGVYQMEPATHDDIWENYLRYSPGLAAKVTELLAPWPERDYQLITNLAYATAMCRIQYFRRPEPLPPADDLRALGAYYKRWYNTPAGAATIDEFVTNYRRAGADRTTAAA